MIEFFQSNLWLLWTLIGVIALILELTSGDFFFMCFTIAAIPAAMLAGLSDVTFTVQLITWLVFAVLCLLIVRPVALKYLHKKDKHVATNADALLGREGKVIEEIAPGESGYVAIDGDQWRAVSRETNTIPVGTTVKVVDRKSIIVTVETVG